MCHRENASAAVLFCLPSKKNYSKNELIKEKKLTGLILLR